jgi:periplasmic protein CpxP/Spy
MPKFFHRILLTALTSVLLIPFTAQAQPQDQSQPQNQDQGQSSQPQTESKPGTQPRGQWRGRMGAQRERQHMAMLAQKLNLTDAQKEQFQQISRDTRKQGMSIRQDSSLTEDQKKEKIQALRKSSHQQMFGVLTPEQKEQLKQMREQHKKDQSKDKPGSDQASAKQNNGSTAAEDDDPFAGMTSDDDEGLGRGF